LQSVLTHTPAYLPPTLVALVCAGAFALAVMGFMALDARKKYHDAIADCAGAPCPPEPYARVQDARSEGNWATVVGIIGLAAVGGGLDLWLLNSPSGGDTGATTTARVDRVGVGPGGFVLGGRF